MAAALWMVEGISRPGDWTYGGLCTWKSEQVLDLLNQSEVLCPLLIGLVSFQLCLQESIRVEDLLNHKLSYIRTFFSLNIAMATGIRCGSILFIDSRQSPSMLQLLKSSDKHVNILLWILWSSVTPGRLTTGLKVLPISKFHYRTLYVWQISACVPNREHVIVMPIFKIHGVALICKTKFCIITSQQIFSSTVVILLGC